MRALRGQRVPRGSGPARGDGPARPELPAALNAEDDASASTSQTRSIVLSVNSPTTTGPNGVDRLLRRLDALAKLHGVLEQEYEDSLRMLREARTDLRDIQEQLRKQSKEKPKQ